METVRSAISLRPWANANISGRHNNDGMPEHQVAFTVGVIVLGAKMGKVDGIVTRDEVLVFKEVFKVPEGETKNVSSIFNLAKQDIVGYESYASQLASLLKDNHRTCLKVSSTSPWQTAAKLDVRLWHIADFFSRLAECLLSGVKRTSRNGSIDAVL